MKALVVYDSFFGNTEKIAQEVGRVLGTHGDVQVLRVASASPGQLADVDLLIVGSPTRSLRPSPAITTLIKGIPTRALNGVKVAAFDTRFSQEKLKALSFLLPIMSSLFGGYAGKPIADGLVKKGGQLVIPPEGFIVEDTEGPLREGELERAANWAKQIMSTL